MRTRFLRTLAGAAAAPLLLGALAGCGDDADDDEIGTVAPTGTPEGQVAAEPPVPDDVEPDDAPPGELELEEFAELVAAGVEALTTARVTTRTTTGGATSVVEGVIARDGDSFASRQTLTFEGEDQAMEMVLVDDRFYLLPPGAETWTTMSAEEALGDDGLGTANFDPAGMTEAAVAAITSVETVGDEEVDGVATTHYRVSSDFQQMMSIFEGEQADVDGPDELVQDLWLDSRGRAVRSSYEMEVGAATISSETVMTDFGLDVDIQAPPTEKVDEAPDGAE